VGPQALALPAEGLEQIRFEGSGTSFRLTVLPTPGRLLGSPVVSSDGRDLVVRFPAAPQSQSLTWMPNLNRPTPVPTETFVPPLRPRAVAPPVGDMAVATMTTRTKGWINVTGPLVSLTLRNASPESALLELANLGGYGFVSIPDSKSCQLGLKETTQTTYESGYSYSVTRDVATGASSASDNEAPPKSQRGISLIFRNQSYQRALNAVVLAAGWRAKLDGNIIFAGPSVLCDAFGVNITKVIRLNQADPQAAAAYLSTLGALGKRPTLKEVLTTSGPSQGDRQASSQSTQQEKTEEVAIELFRSPTGPLLGLEVSFDLRLGLITLVGSPDVVSMAEAYLRQFDLRKRQVALSITILDLDVSNDSSFSSSFAYRSGNNFIVNDAGKLFANIGDSGQSPPFNAPDGDFVAFLRSQIISQNAKIVASPTLIMQEGAELQASDVNLGGVSLSGRSVGSAVNVGASVITNFDPSTDSFGNTVCKPRSETAGLTMFAKVNKVDDNGYVTFDVRPSISAPVGTQVVPGCGTINILNSRTLTTSSVRVRDGQTLILTGVISDEDRVVINKWPILGDFPIIGSLFRSSGRNRVKRELVILVTPRIVDDAVKDRNGYGYTPVADDARRILYGQ
jgi:type IV pilus assembly protein PilQ